MDVFFALACLTLSLALAIVYRKKRREAALNAKNLDLAAAQLAAAEEDRKHLAKQMADATRSAEEARHAFDAVTERFRPVLDAERRAAEIQQLAAAELAEAKRYVDQIRQMADAELAAAREQMVAIKKDVRDNEKALRALRNKIDGYGDEYILPTQSLLDDLAEAFGFDDAGKALKEARSRSVALVKSGKAAVCDYVEDNRRTSAINFVIDAFNGKVDTLQARIKADNAGTLMQKVEDAFALVNHHGTAFRNARITPDYLAARKEEVKWGAVVQALKERARDEQRALKEQMREEERARHEYEKAMKDAAKEEEKAALALEKAQLAYAKAQTDSERRRLEERIAEFEAQLVRAHEKATQAVSMAQLTRSGHVYIISNIGSFGESVLKIGMTRRLEPMERVKELGDASVPFPFDVHGMIYSDDAVALEAELHSRFNQNRVNKVNFRKEFFRVSLDDIRQVASDLELDIHITILAEALEYRETLAIEHLPEVERAAVLEHGVNAWGDNPIQRLLEDKEDAMMAE